MPRLKNLIILTLIIALSSQVALDLTYAEDSSSSADKTELTDNLRERLKDVLDSPSQPSKARGYVGIVKDIIKSTIVLEGKDGKQNIVISDTTKLLRSPGNKSIKIEDVQIDDNIIAIGNQVEGNELLGERLIVSSKSFSPPAKLSGIGVVSAIGKFSFTIKTTDTDSLELFFTNTTEYKSSESKLEFADIHEGDQILFAAIRDKDNDWSATQVLRTIESLPSPTKL